MSNPKILFPLLLVLMLSCFCLAAQAQFEMQQRAQQTTAGLLDLSQTQAESIAQQAEAIKIQAETNQQALASQAETIKSQQFQLTAGLFIEAVLAAAVFVLALALLLSRQRAANHQPSSGA